MSDVYEGMDWVFELDKKLWDDAVVKVISIEEIVPAQNIVTVHGMASIKEIRESNYTGYLEPILVIKTGEGFVLRDGHHRYVYGMIHDQDFFETKVIEDPR